LNILLSVKYYRTLSNGQCGEIHEINGDQVAVIFDPPEEKLADGEKDEANEEQHAEPAVYWVDSMLLIPSLQSATFSFGKLCNINVVFFYTLAQDIVHDTDIQSEDWHIAIEALCEVPCWAMLIECKLYYLVFSYVNLLHMY
jgi:hypothetical protein